MPFYMIQQYKSRSYREQYNKREAVVAFAASGHAKTWHAKTRLTGPGSLAGWLTWEQLTQYRRNT